MKTLINYYRTDSNVSSTVSCAREFDYNNPVDRAWWFAQFEENDIDWTDNESRLAAIRECCVDIYGSEPLALPPAHPGVRNGNQDDDGFFIF